MKIKLSVNGSMVGHKCKNGVKLVKFLTSHLPQLNWITQISSNKTNLCHIIN